MAEKINKKQLHKGIDCDMCYVDMFVINNYVIE